MPRRNAIELYEEPLSGNAPRSRSSAPRRAGRKGGLRQSVGGGDAALSKPSSLSPAQRKRQRRAERGLLLLRLTLVAALAMVIGVSIASYNDIEQLVQDQRALNAGYRLHTQAQDVAVKVRDAQIAQDSFTRSGTSRLRFRSDDSLAAARSALAEFRDAMPASLRSDTHGLDLVNDADALLTEAKTSPERYDQALGLIRQISALQTPALNRLSDRIEDAARREREYSWMRTCGMIALLGASFLLFWRDISLREQQEQELRSANRTLTRLAEQDSLTRLKNRRALEEKLRSEWTRARRNGLPLSLLFVDVDRFKQYNDSFGHLAGDEVLRKVAWLLQSRSRSSDFVARYGGEEFAVLLPQTSAADARVLGDRLRRAFEEETWPGRPVTASVGVATLSPDAEDVESLLYEADIALYFAKHNGRNRVAHADEVVKLR